MLKEGLRMRPGRLAADSPEQMGGNADAIGRSRGNFGCHGDGRAGLWPPRVSRSLQVRTDPE